MITIGFGVFTILIFIFLCFVVYKKSGKQTPEHNINFVNATSAFQNLAILVSIFVTGVWAVYSFDALKQKENAELVYEQLKEKINNTESSEISIRTNIVDYQSAIVDESIEKTKGLIIEIDIVNKGISRIDFDLSNDPLIIYEIESYQSDVAFKQRITPKLIKSPQKLLDKNSEVTLINQWSAMIDSKRSLSYFMTVSPNKLYYIVFSTPIELAKPKDDSEKRDDDLYQRCNLDSECTLFASKYIYVE